MRAGLFELTNAAGIFIYLVIQCIIGDCVPETDGKLKRWGNSFGVVLPADLIKKSRMKEGQDIHIIFTKKSDVLKKTFGTLKTKKSAQEIKDELRAELYGD